MKIYPNHVVTFALAMLLFAAPVTAISAWLPNLLLLHAWFPSIDIFLSVNGPSWSLCIELLFYLAFPFMLRWLWNIPEERLWASAGLTVVSLVAVQLGIHYLISDQPHISQYPISLDQWWLAYYFPPFRLFEFVLGMIMARILMAGRWPRVNLPSAIVLVCVGYYAAGEVPFFYGLSLTTLVPIAILITSLADADIRGRPSWFRHPVMVWLGEVSFGFYMIHLLVMMYVSALLKGQLFATTPATLILLATFCLSLLAGWLLFTFVETPAMRRWGKANPVRPFGIA